MSPVIFNSTNEVAASKSLSRIKIRLDCDTFHLHVVWCRTVYSRHEKWNRKSHRHTFYEFHLALQGSCEFLRPDASPITMEAGDFILFRPNEIHSLASNSEDFAKFIMGFNIEFNPEFPDGKYLGFAFDQIQTRTYRSTRRMLTYVHDLEESAFNDQSSLSSIASFYLSLLLIEAAHQICPGYAASFAMDKKVFEDDTRIEYIKKFISDNIGCGLTNDLLSRQVSLSSKQINRILQKNLNLSIKQIVAEQKMILIKKLLATTNLTLDQVAEKAGFSNQYNLSRFFKNNEGMSPGHYRRSLEN